MKKLLLILVAVLLLTGCTNINKLDIKDLVNETTSKNINLNNQYRTGYKYYLPRGLSVISQSDYNEKFNSDRYTYYLYVDIVSYYYNVKKDYKVDKSAYYSQELKNGKKFGYIEINRINDKYLVEIMYNYAKIEVIVKDKDINNAIVQSITILNSIKYNKNIIGNDMGDNVLHYKETELNIFDTKKSENKGNFINYEEMYGQYEEKTHDSDLIE